MDEFVADAPNWSIDDPDQLAQRLAYWRERVEQYRDTSIWDSVHAGLRQIEDTLTYARNYPRPGLVVDHWRLEVELAETENSTVWQALDLRDQSLAAVKISALSEEDGTLASPAATVLEARDMQRLHHPALIPALGAPPSDGSFPIGYLVMHLCGDVDPEDGRLVVASPMAATSERIWRPGQARDIGELIAWMIEIAAAVDVMHQAGRIHFDLHRRQILIAPLSRRPFLSDYGAAPRIGDLSDPRNPVWNHLCAAPESHRIQRVIFNEGVADADLPQVVQQCVRMDVFGLGGILFEQLAGLQPRAYLTHRTIEAKLTKIEEEPFPKLPESGPLGPIPAELREIVHRATAHDPAQRIPTAASLVGQLTTWLAQRDEGDRHAAT